MKYLILILFSMATVSSYSQNSEDNEIASLVLNTIGQFNYFYGAPPPPPPTEQESIEFKQCDSLYLLDITVNNPAWEKYNNAVKNAQKKQGEHYAWIQSLDRKIIIETTPLEYPNPKYLDIYLENKSAVTWESKNFTNNSIFELVDSNIHSTIDTIHIGKLSISKVRYNKDKTKAIIYYDFDTGATSRCFIYSDYTIFEKQNSQWIIVNHEEY